MTSDPGSIEPQPPGVSATASPPEPKPGSRPARPQSDAILPFGMGDRLDEIAQERFNRTDWIEVAAAIILALATIMAAWSAYQATRWGGVQANAFSAAGAARTDATQENSIFAAQVQIDVLLWLEYLKQDQAGETAGAAFLEERFRDEFRDAHEEWLALMEAGEVPPGTPFDLESYAPASERRAIELNQRADELAAEAREANQTSDNFVLVAVIMASVLFFAGVGTKFKGRAVRLVMLTMAFVLFVAGVAFTFSMPQNVGL